MRHWRKLFQSIAKRFCLFLINFVGSGIFVGGAGAALGAAVALILSTDKSDDIKDSVTDWFSDLLDSSKDKIADVADAVKEKISKASA